MVGASVSCAWGLEEWVDNVVISMRLGAVVLALRGGAFCVVHECGCVCVMPNLFNNIQSVHYHTSPLYSNVCTAAMFGFWPFLAGVCVCVCVCVCVSDLALLQTMSSLSSPVVRLP